MGECFSVLPIRGKLSAYYQEGASPSGKPLEGAYGQRGSILTFSDTFLTPKAPKNGNFWKILGKIGFSDQFLAPQAPKILTNFGILVKNRPIL